jgi:hypothetical protein
MIRRSRNSYSCGPTQCNCMADGRVTGVNLVLVAREAQPTRGGSTEVGCCFGSSCPCRGGPGDRGGGVHIYPVVVEGRVRCVRGAVDMVIVAHVEAGAHSGGITA